MRLFKYFSGVVLFLFLSCDNTVSSNVDDVDYTYNKIYVTLQSTDKIAILNSHTLEMIDILSVIEQVID